MSSVRLVSANRWPGFVTKMGADSYSVPMLLFVKKGQEYERVNTKLPEYLARVMIKDMIVGEKAYTVPWSLQVDQDGVCWLRGDYAFRYRKFGTSTMLITRTAEGFEVKLSSGARFEQLCLPPEARSTIVLLPVVKVH